MNASINITCPSLNRDCNNQYIYFNFREKTFKVSLKAKKSETIILEDVEGRSI